MMRNSAMLALYNRSFPRLQTDLKTFCMRLQLDGGSLVIEHTESNVLKGFSVVNENSILLLCVDQSDRGRGIGADLLSLSEKHIGKRFDEVCLGASPNTFLLCGVPLGGGCDARSFFLQHGYVESWIACDMIIDLNQFSHVSDYPFDDLTIRRRRSEKNDIEKARLCGDCINGWGDLYAAAPELIVAEIAEEIIGGVIVASDCLFPKSFPHAGSFGCLGVVEAYRNCGIGRRLCQEALASLKTAGCRTCYIGYTYLDQWYGKLGAVKYIEYWIGTKKLIRQ